MNKKIRIGNGAGFWGDHLKAPLYLAREGDLDYLTLEYLAEVTMGILAYQKNKDQDRGYVTDFPRLLKELIPVLKENPNLKIITNAGGLNVLACARIVAEILSLEGMSNLKIATCSGDDVLPTLNSTNLAYSKIVHFETGQKADELTDTFLNANAYFGAANIVDALNSNARIVITGRIADAALTLGPCIYEFNWGFDDYDLLASASAAGHLIECGAQVSGGNWSGWKSLNEEDFINIGYPICEIDEQGNILISKNKGSGGIVNIETVKEQLLYETTDPSHYITPDVVMDYSQSRVEEVKPNTVSISGLKGYAPPEDYKISASYRDGYFYTGQLSICGPDIYKKAKLCESIILGRLAKEGIFLKQVHVEWLGHGGLIYNKEELKFTEDNFMHDLIFRMSAQDPSERNIYQFSREFSPLVTTGPPGISGYIGGLHKVQAKINFFPFLLPKNEFTGEISIKIARDWEVLS